LRVPPVRQPYLPRFMAGGETNPLGALSWQVTAAATSLALLAAMPSQAAVPAPPPSVMAR
jgi:hypothetical protein